jgi:hypothetical protein
MTRKKRRPIPTVRELIRGCPAFKDFVAENWPGKEPPTPADVKRFAKWALRDARLYIREASSGIAHKTTETKPLMSPLREAAINFVMNLQVTYLLATGEQPSFTATRTRRGPFARILRECLLLLKAPVDDITLINTLQERSNKMTDQRGQPRRRRKGPRA